MKIGDKVKMTAEGFQYYHNLNERFDNFQLAGVIQKKYCTSMLCETLAVLGTGVVVAKNEDNYKVRWELKHAGMYFYAIHCYDPDHIRPLNFWEKLCSILFN